MADQELSKCVNQERRNDFTSLIFYQLAIVLAKELYPKTLEFPAHEKFNLGDQIRRSLTSVTANIAEGYGRNTFPDRRNFFVNARGTVCELMSHLTMCEISGVLKREEADNYRSKCRIIRFLLNRYLKWLEKNSRS